MRILCVDDDRATLTLISRSLAKAFPADEVLAALSGEEAMLKIEAVAVEIVVTDLVMPGISGIELLDRVKQDRPETEVIIITAFSSVETAVDAMQKGARDYLAKPISMDLLIEKLENLKEFMENRQEIEEYRFAMEAIEEDVARSTHKAREDFGEVRAVMLQIGEILASPAKDDIKLRLIRESLGCMGMSGAR